MSTQNVDLILESAGEGGTEVYVEALADYLAGHAADVNIIVLSGSLEVAQRRFPKHNIYVEQTMKGLTKRLKSRSTVASLHVYSKLFPAVMAAKRARVPVVTTLHQPLAPWSWRHRQFWRMAIGLSDITIGVSQACLHGFGPFLRKPSYVLPGPLPFDEMPAPRSKWRPNSLFTVAFTGRLSKEKSLPVLFDALALCADARLIIIGDGPERASLNALHEALGLDVIFKGQMSRQDVFATLQNVDAFVLPSKFEGLGLAAIEAMALGIPTIVSNFPAAKEYIDPEITGLSFPVGDAAALAAQIMRLRTERDLPQGLSTAGSTYVRNKFTVDIQYGSYLTLFEEIMSKPLG